MNPPNGLPGLTDKTDESHSAVNEKISDLGKCVSCEIFFKSRESFRSADIVAGAFNQGVAHLPLHKTLFEKLVKAARRLDLGFFNGDP
jgi:hypothetical protein